MDVFSLLYGFYLGLLVAVGIAILFHVRMTGKKESTTITKRVGSG